MNVRKQTGTEITILLRRVREGDSSAEDELFQKVLAELKRLAARFLRGERPDHTLQPTALVNEAYIRLASTDQMEYSDRHHFFAVASQVMRRLLVDYARKRSARKRDFGKPVPLDENIPMSDERAESIEHLDRALERLAVSEPRQAAVVEMRFFGGMTEQEIAEYLQVSTKTVRRDWALARATLHAELNQDLS